MCEKKKKEKTHALFACVDSFKSFGSFCGFLWWIGWLLGRQNSGKSSKQNQHPKPTTDPWDFLYVYNYIDPINIIQM